MIPYYDYTFKFPISALSTALAGFQALQTAGLLGPGDIPQNMLGDPRDASGALVDPSAGTPVAWIGRPGSDAAGDPTQYYVAIRASIAPADLTIDPTKYGLVATDPEESASVLGVWA